MRFALERRRIGAPLAEAWLVEVVTPRTNAASLTSAENLLAAVALAEPFALEIAADHQRRRFLVRSASSAMRQHLDAQVGAAYPQADLRLVEPEADPATLGEGEQLAACALELRSPAYLPIRTFSDAQVDAERSALADPVLGILGALPDLPAGWCALSQLVLEPAPEDWCRDFLRLAVQHPLAHERIPQPAEGSLQAVFLLTVVLAAACIGLQAYALYRSGNWLALAGLAAASMLALLALPILLRRLLSRPIYDMDLVRDKVSRLAYRAELRLAVVAPAAAPVAEVRARLARLAAAYRHYNLAAGNGFRSRPLTAAGRDLRQPRAFGSAGHLPVLTTRELAGLWHLPHAAADVPLLERTTARRWLPMPLRVAQGCRIGVSTHQGRAVPVALPEDVLWRHLLLVAKTRRGKSTLLLRLACYAMQASPRRGVVLVDPHTDMAEAALGVVPAERDADVVYLNVADEARPFGLNLLDTGLGWDRERAVQNTLAIFKREWDGYWGPRMEDVFRFALLTLFEANAAICAADPLGGRQAQHTILEVPTLLGDAAFRRQVLAQVAEPSIHAWWADYYERLERRFQQEVINPVVTKVHRFEGSRFAAHIVGQPCSTIDPVAWLRAGAIILVNTAKGAAGENAAALIGGTLVNLVALAVAEQASAQPEARRPMSLFVDEFHTMPGADYETILSELSKYGANMVLATQSLARLEALDPTGGRGLRASVFANLDGLFAFNCSAEDARYLVPELGGALDEQDLVELGEHQCYARLSAGGQRLPTFWLELDPPLRPDPDARAARVAASAIHYGRDIASVLADRQAARARVALAHQPLPTDGAAALSQEPTAPIRRARNQHRPRKARRAEPWESHVGAP